MSEYRYYELQAVDRPLTQLGRVVKEAVQGLPVMPARQELVAYSDQEDAL
jgi:hypothetical protein